MWNFVEVDMGSRTHRGRYRMEGDQLVLEWRGGRLAARCGLVRPDVVALDILRQSVASGPIAA
jgi:hypothetical protein